MTQQVRAAADPAPAAEQPVYYSQFDRPSRLGQAVAAVCIVAGVVFVVAVIFFTGFFVGVHRGGDDGYYDWGHMGHMGHVGPYWTPPPMMPSP
jgi:hypothetical protein